MSTSQYCDFSASLTCPRCGYQAARPNTYRACVPPPDKWRPIMLGDLVEKGLTAIGITSAKIEQATGKPCGCGGRKKWLNEAGIAVQQAARSGLHRAKRFYLGN